VCRVHLLLRQLAHAGQFAASGFAPLNSALITFAQTGQALAV